MEKCLQVWGEEEAACMNDCDQPRKDCYAACTTASCKDQCDLTWMKREGCCHRTCPCHSKCPNGCPCYADPDCEGIDGIDGIDYCEDSTWKPDPNCLVEYEEIVKKCIQPCLDDSYDCAVACNGDKYCVNRCKQAEEACKSNCPCYENCPDGCPCFDHCGSNPCSIVWPDEKKCCEDKCQDKHELCLETCNGHTLCEEDCHNQFAHCTTRCPCHKYCPHGCPCDNNLSARVHRDISTVMYCLYSYSIQLKMKVS